MLRLVLVALFLFSMLLAGYSDADGRVGQAPTALIGSKLSTLSLLVVGLPHGQGFLDNFLPCPRRGVVDYHRIRGGRLATFSGCDLGDGVTVDGSADLRSRVRSLSRSRGKLLRLKLSGEITVTVSSLGAVHVKHMTVKGIARKKKSFLKSLRIRLFGRTVRFDKRGSLQRFFAPQGLDLNTIPNPSNSLAALTEADVKRIAFDGAITLMAYLIDETQEIDRGEHTHRYSCGTRHVVPNPAKGGTHLDYVLRACDLGGSQLFIDGSFSQDPMGRKLSGMLVQGRITLGGGVPRITLDRLEWSISGVASYPAKARISGRMLAGSQERVFAFDVVVDD